MSMIHLGSRSSIRLWLAPFEPRAAAPSAIVRPPPGMWRGIGIAAGLCVAAAALHLALGDADSGRLPAAGFLAATGLAAALAGRAAGLWALTFSLLLIAAAFPGRPGAGSIAELLVFAAASVCVAAAGAGWRAPALAGIEQRHRRLLSVLAEGYAVCRPDRDGRDGWADLRIVECNEALSRLLGVSPGQRIGSSDVCRGTDWRLRVGALPVEPGEERRVSLAAPRDGRVVMRLIPADDGTDALILLVEDHAEVERVQRVHAEQFQELNHRVKNSLACVAGVLTLQARRPFHPAAREQLLKGADRIQAIAAVHESLYRSGRKEFVELSAYIRGMCERLAATLAPERRLEVEVQAAPVLAPIQQAAALGLIANELVTNAVKHAYGEADSGVITVGLCPVAEGVLLTVCDQGRGRVEDVSGQGLGMMLVRSLTEQLGGRFRIRQAHPGLMFELRAPLSAAALPAPEQASLF